MASVVAYEGEDGESGEGEGLLDNEIERKKPHVHHQRKRKKSLRESDGVYVPPYKKNRFRRQVSVLPSKFLLGGNIRDPLNLASLADAKVNAELNRVTPKPSPVMVNADSKGEIPVFIPRNPDDPLGLNLGSDDPNDIILGVRVNRSKKRHRRRSRRRTDSECSVGTDTLGEEEEEEKVEVRSKKEGRVEVVEKKQEGRGRDEVFEEKKDDKAADVGQSQPPKVLVVEKKASPKKETKPVVEPKQEEKEVVKEIAAGKEKKEVEVVKKEAEVKKKDDSAAVKPPPVENTNKEPSTVTPDTKTPKSGGGSAVYPCKSSEYVPLSSSYAPSPYIFDTMNPEDGFEVKPFESPSLTNYYCNALTPSHLMEPFSPPPRPEIPHFQRRMEMMSNVPHRPPEMSLQRAVFQKPFYRRRFRHKSDPIVSPVIPQPGSGKKRNQYHHHNHNHRHGKKNEKQGNSLNISNSSTASTHSSASKKTTAKGKQPAKNEITNFRSKDEIYQFGNYKQYYGYRTPDGEDSRLWVLKKEWFRGKDVLDIGCNIGHVSLSIARDFEAQRVHGIDIDNNLITMARKNIKHYMIHDPSDKSVVFPHSLPMIYGAMQPPSGVGRVAQQFPFNVMFSQENYVLSNDAMLENVKPEYDVIICLSVTKWIHLNFGDDGLKRFFRRMYKHLRNKGRLILEPQEWSSYYRKRKLTPKISENYKNIRFIPDQFQDFLVNEVGFTFVQKVGTPHHSSKGFQRPMLIFTKESKSKGNSPASEQNTPNNSATSTATDSNSVKPAS